MDESKPWALDRMSRRGVAKFLTNYLDSNSKVKVLNINAAWGSGKTFFLLNWCKEQRQGRACVYFNAWETDFSGDAFISLVAAIREQLGDVVGRTHQAESVVRQFTSRASKTLIAATPALAKGIVQKFTGVDVAVLSGIIDKDSLADAAEKAVEKLIESNQTTLNTVADFKQVFNKLIDLSANAAANGEEVKPVYIYIDELDRCRPTYAIELLERIKHLFDVQGCKFIIATDTSQLSHSIRAVYGSGFGSEKYLKRFFDAEFTLHNTDMGPWVKANFVLAGTKNPIRMDLQLKPFSRERRLPDIPHLVHPDQNTVLTDDELDLNEEQVILLALIYTFDTSLRELEKNVMQIEFVLSNVKGSHFIFFWAAYLVFLKDAAPDVYETAIRGDFTLLVETLNARFPSKNLYFLISLTSVHEIFLKYLVLYRGGRESAHQANRRGNGMELLYIQKAIEGFADNDGALFEYPKLVELAHNLE